jgi:hypothetical protein
VQRLAVRRARIAFALAACAALGTPALGCKHSGSAKLEGRWRGTRAEGVPADKQAEANSFALATDLVARGNQIAITTPTRQPRQGTYVIDSEEKDTLVIHTDKDGPQRETFVFAPDGKTMTWRLDEKRSITFQRLPPQ